MSVKTKFAVALATAVTMITGALASANTVSANFLSANPGNQAFNVTYRNTSNVSTSTGNIRAGLMNWTQTAFTGSGTLVGNNSNFVTYCIDLAQNVNSNTFNVTSDASTVPNPLTSTGSLTTAWAGDSTKTKEAALKRLYAKHFNAANTSGDYHAAFQLAVWEIIFETTTGDKSLTSGTTLSTGVAAAISQASLFVTNLYDGGTFAEGSFVYLTGNNNQDQIFYRPLSFGDLPVIPLPAASLGGLMLLGMIGAKRSMK